MKMNQNFETLVYIWKGSDILFKLRLIYVGSLREAKDRARAELRKRKEKGIFYTTIQQPAQDYYKATNIRV
jgi:hypothetical protein